MNLVVKKSRKVYFTTYERMLACLNRIIELQGFGKSRKSQYETLERFTVMEEDDCERSLVRHRKTGRTFIMKTVSENISPNLVTMAMYERDILIRCNKVSQIVRLVDSFIERDCNYLLIENPSGDNLK